MSSKHVADQSDTDRRLAALMTNAAAVRAVVEVVEGTLGPKGLDCMLVDEDGSVKVTNDGVTILKTMDVNHPAARILISAAEYQEEMVGDGTTTATLLAGALIAEAVNEVLKGVPVTQVIEGIRLGIAKALEFLEEAAVRLGPSDWGILKEIALIAGRGYSEIAELVIDAARAVGAERLNEEGFLLSDQVMALEGACSQAIIGTIVNKEPINREMPRDVRDAKVMILDDALDVQTVDPAALATEAGLKRRMDAEAELQDAIRTIAGLGVRAVFTDRAVSGLVEDLLTELGIIAVERVAYREWRRLAELTGARPVKRSSLLRPREELEAMLGNASRIMVNERFRQVWVYGGPSKRFVTAVVGGTTPEVVAEKERIARDAAGAVQAAWKSGIVPGGGSVELAIARRLSRVPVSGMSRYGFQCVIEALKRPMAQICLNAGWNPLEKIEEVLEHIDASGTYAYGVNCDTGKVEDLSVSGVWDPYAVKYHAIKTAGEVSEAILRINTIIKMKEKDQQTMH
ncbi:MAG TPA: TCP-1/cpn60 chaperonin family protein [Bacillota bacterium]|nr:TCP-1/cpn60 chaperonin family protein [Bacillota bacterium]